MQHVARSRLRISLALAGLVAALALTSISIWGITARSKGGATKGASEPTATTPTEPSFDVLTQVTRLNETVGSPARTPSATVQAVRKALAAGDVAAARGDWPIAQLYWLNAITRSPGELEPLRHYVQAVLNRGDATNTDLDRLNSTLELASYQVDPDDLPRLLEWMNQVETRRAQLNEREREAEGIDISEAEDSLIRLMAIEMTPATDLKESERVSRVVDELTETRRILDEAGRDDLADECRMLQHRWERYGRVLSTCRFIDECLTKLETLDPTSQTAVVMVQAAENALTGFWGEPLDDLPRDLQARVLGSPDGAIGYAQRIQDQVETISAARSQPILARIKEIAARTTPDDLPKWQDHIEQRQADLREINNLLVQISSRPLMEAAQKEQETVAQQIQEYRQKQFDAYQQWAVNCLAAAFNDWNANKKKYWNMLVDNNVHQIDESLLSPPVARLYQDIAGKVLGKFSADLFVKYHIVTSKPNMKQKLENF